MRSLALTLLLLLGVAASAAPRRSPPFSILRPGKPAVSLSQYRGKVVVLAFIDTECTHCQELTNLLNQLAPRYAARGVQFLECAFNGGAALRLPEFLDRFHPPFPVGYADHAAVLSYLGISILDPHPLYVPHLVILDAAGMVRGDFPGGSAFFAKPEENLRQELSKLLRPSAAAR